MRGVKRWRQASPLFSRLTQLHVGLELQVRLPSFLIHTTPASTEVFDGIVYAIIFEEGLLEAL